MTKLNASEILFGLKNNKILTQRKYMLLHSLCLSNDNLNDNLFVLISVCEQVLQFPVFQHLTSCCLSHCGTPPKLRGHSNELHRQ